MAFLCATVCKRIWCVCVCVCPHRIYALKNTITRREPEPATEETPTTMTTKVRRQEYTTGLVHARKTQWKTNSAQEQLANTAAKHMEIAGIDDAKCKEYESKSSGLSPSSCSHIFRRGRPRLRSLNKILLKNKPRPRKSYTTP